MLWFKRGVKRDRIRPEQGSAQSQWCLRVRSIATKQEGRAELLKNYLIVVSDEEPKESEQKQAHVS